MDTKTMGERIRDLLEEKGMSQKELSVAAQITEAAISHYIKGDRVPRSTVLARIAQALGTTAEYLLDGAPNDVKGELGYARRLIARNVEQMSTKEKMDLISILMGGNDE